MFVLQYLPPHFPSENERQSEIRVAVAWVLIGTFLLQPILTYLVTPLIDHDAQGEQIVICTLQGERTVTLDLSDGEGESGHCPALELFQVAGTSQISAPPTMPVSTLYVVEVLQPTANVTHRRLHFSAYATRAPPIA